VRITSIVVPDHVVGIAGSLFIVKFRVFWEKCIFLKSGSEFSIFFLFLILKYKKKITYKIKRKHRMPTVLMYKTVVVYIYRL